MNHSSAMDGGHVSARFPRSRRYPVQPAPANPQTHAYWVTLLFIAGYFVAAVACLWQWHSPRPWERLDVFSVGFLVVSLVWGCATMGFHRSIFRSREVMEEAAGVTYDPWMLRWITIFAIAELSVFLDYGHWHLVPQLLESRASNHRPRALSGRRRLADLDRSISGKSFRRRFIRAQGDDAAGHIASCGIRAMPRSSPRGSHSLSRSAAFWRGSFSLAGCG